MSRWFRSQGPRVALLVAVMTNAPCSAVRSALGAQVTQGIQAITQADDLLALEQLMNGLARPHGFACQDEATAVELAAGVGLEAVQERAPGFSLERTRELQLSYLPSRRTLRLVLQVGPVQWVARCPATAAPAQQTERPASPNQQKARHLPGRGHSSPLSALAFMVRHLARGSLRTPPAV